MNANFLARYRFAALEQDLTDDQKVRQLISVHRLMEDLLATS